MNKITINDVADALGVSKSTVSRAISGKGRIGEETKSKVLKYIEENNYTPNLIAKSLVESRTYNIALGIPTDCQNEEVSFFQKCMLSIVERAAKDNYDLIITNISEDGDLRGLERIVNNHKIDGLILGRTLEKDPYVKYLKKKKMPFVTIGTTYEENVLQIDHNHQQACKELTSILIRKKVGKIGLIGGNQQIVVNQKRFHGFQDAFREMNEQYDEACIYLNIQNRKEVDKIVERLVQNKVECIVCMDDLICQQVIDKVVSDHMRIPEDIKVASFYDSALHNTTGILGNVTSIHFDAHQMGDMACDMLIHFINGKTDFKRKELDYQINLRYSTHSEEM